jgi:hypothetical protein
MREALAGESPRTIHWDLTMIATGSSYTHNTLRVRGSAGGGLITWITIGE